MLSRFLRIGRAADRQPAAIPVGIRVYAIGDIHGCLDLLDEILAQIDADDAAGEPASTVRVVLGDIIDRGPNSADVVERLRKLKLDQPATRLLLGNHEEMFLAALNGDPQAVRAFCRVGGRETLLSYGMSETAYERMDFDEAAAALAMFVPESHRRFIAGFEDMVLMGDYAFVHAGIDPAIPLLEQRTSSLRWIRQPFLAHRGHLEKIIVHGHTVNHEVELRANRIGLDTGAYQTGKLSAICLEGTQRRVFQTC